MRAWIFLFAVLTMVVATAVTDLSSTRAARLAATALQAKAQPASVGQMQGQLEGPLQRRLQSNSLCASTERIIFSCLTKRAGAMSAKSPLKIVSLCASRDLTKDQGYLQYRYGLPGKVELEFPTSRSGTQQQFQYTHYMRYQVDLTEINFDIDGYQYQIFDDYNGEERPRISAEGVVVTAPGKSKGVTFGCRTKVKADYSMLDDVLRREP